MYEIATMSGDVEVEHARAGVDRDKVAGRRDERERRDDLVDVLGAADERGGAGVQDGVQREPEHEEDPEEARARSSARSAAAAARTPELAEHERRDLVLEDDGEDGRHEHDHVLR